MNYRSDIDGLRAIAVLAVVIFHLGVPGFDGGYVGVDVFFVISGFLITTIVVRDIEAGRFSLSQFYARRIRRLVPALIATVAGTTVGAALILSPYDMISYGRSAVAALFSLSNFVFFTEAGYWDTESELKPLLHTWSLGVEEQFYLFWPGLLVALVALRGRLPIWASLTIVSIISLAGCIWYSYIDESAAFYLLPFRVFQFALGAVSIYIAARMAVKPNSVINGALFWVGLLLIAISIVLFDESVLFPGWIVLIPTLGAMMMLIAGANGLPSSCALLVQNLVSVWIGRVSYSMYLVHWPVVALFRYEYGIDIEPMDQLWLGGLILVLTVVLHYGIEKQFYKRGHDQTRPPRHGRFALATVGVAALVAVAPANAWLGDGWGWRFPPMALTPEDISAGKSDRFTYTRQACRVHHSPTDPRCEKIDEPTILIFGNSHEPDGYNFLRGYLQEIGAQANVVIFGTTNLCKNLHKEGTRYHSSNIDCQKRLDALFSDDFISQIDMLFYASNKPFTGKETMRDLIAEILLRNTQMKVAVLGGYINTKRDCAHLVNETGRPEACLAEEHVSYFEKDPQALPNYPDLMALADVYIDRVAILCDGQRKLESCMSAAEDGTPMFFDQHHHSRPFAEMTGRFYAQSHPNLLELSESR